MLEALRTAAGTWVAKALLAMLVLSFAVWGISGRMLGSFGGTDVITAGGTSVSINDYRLAYERQLAILFQRLGQRLTREQADALGIGDQVLAQLVAGAVLDEQARSMSLGVSEARLARLIAEDPAFKGPDGNYDRRQFEAALRAIGMRPEDYLRDRQRVAVRQQIVAAATDDISTPDTFLRAVALYRGEDRTIDYVLMPKSLVEPVADPTDDEIKAWYEQNKADFGAPEYRKFDYVKLEPGDIADPAAVPEADVRADYERDKDRYTTPEKRTIEQLVFPDRATADAAAAAIKAGTIFEDVITQQGKTATDVALGSKTRAEMVDPAIGDAVFALAEGGVSDVIEGLFGPVLLRVTKIEPEVIRSYDEVKDEIRNALALSIAASELLDVHDSYEDARAGGDSLREAAEKLQLKVITVEAIARTGELPDGSVLSTLPESARLLQSVFDSDVGVENAALQIGSAGFVFYEVAGVTQARDRTLEEVRAKAVDAWRIEEGRSRLSAKAEEARKALDSGKSLDDIATENGLTKETKRGLKRDAEDADLGTETVRAVFALAQGKSGLAAAQDGDARVLFTVTEVTEPAGAGPELVPQEVQDQYGAAIADDLLDGLVSRLRGQYDVRLNETALAEARNF